MIRRTTTALGLAISIVAATGAAHAQDFMQVPRVFTRSPEVFRALFEGARCQGVQAIMLGDSQETSPGGAGAIYIPRLQYEFWDRYGASPSTPLAPMAASYGTAPVYADWLLRVANSPPGMVASRLPTTDLPPGASAGSTSTTDGANINAQWNPQLVVLQHDGADLPPNSGLRGLTTFFDRSVPIYLDVFAATNPSSGELVVKSMLVPTSQPSFAAPPLATFVTSMGLASPLPEIRSQRLGPLPSGESGYLQVSISGTDPTKLTDIIGVRFSNGTSPRGWTFTSFSAGGYTAADILERHGGSGPVFQALHPDVLFLSYGANDSGRGVSAEEFEAWLFQVISFVRSHTRPDLPVVILTDPYRRALTPAQEANYDAYPRAGMNMASRDPLVCAVNSRRLLEEAGWTSSSWWYFLSDYVHYSPTGALLKARVEAEALFDTFLPAPPCKVPLREVLCGQTEPCEHIPDRHAPPIPDPGLRSCPGDLNLDGAVDHQDAALLVAILAGEAAPAGPDPDLNQDGNLDSDDLAFLATLIQAGCTNAGGPPW